MPLLKVGDLPKVNSGGHNRPGGVFAGHAAEAAQLKRMTMQDAAKQWGCVREGVKAPTASRTASVIRKGLAVDFQPDDDGYFIAKSRQGTGYVKGTNEVFEVWVKFKRWDSAEEKRKVLAAIARAKKKAQERTAKPTASQPGKSTSKRTRKTVETPAVEAKVPVGASA